MQNNNDDKLAKYNQYFSVEHCFTINAKSSTEFSTCTFEAFLEKIPTPFLLATQVVAIDSAALQPLQTVTGVASRLAQYLDLQSRKIDLLMNYIISEQDEATHRFQGLRFSGSGITFTAKNAFTITEIIELKLFLDIDNCNVYCHGEVIEVSEVDDGYQHKVLFHHIREDDRELLVRCSLHTQQKQLQALAKKRQDQI